MSALSEPILFLFMAMVLECSPVPVSIDEEARIIEAAYASRNEDTAGQAFESVSVTKCVTYFEREGPEPGGARTERVGLYGLLPHVIRTDHYREQYSITCHSSVTYYGDEIVDLSDGCGEELERYMAYHGLDHEVRLRGAVSVEDASDYLDYLLSYDFGQEHQTRINSMLQQIHAVESTKRGSVIRFLAWQSRGGCETVFFETYATREGSLIFRDVDGFREIC